MTASPILSAFGCDLTEADYGILAARWITAEIAEAAGIRRVDPDRPRDVRPEERRPGRPHHSQLFSR